MRRMRQHRGGGEVEQAEDDGMIECGYRAERPDEAEIGVLADTGVSNQG